jgi:nucleotide-binding universal stress UspA family protein
MLSIKQILVPVDFSDRCLGMMRYVRFIARAYGSQVTLLHVVNPFHTIPATAISPPSMIQISPTLLVEKSKELDQVAAAELEGIPVRRFVYEGDTVWQIADFAKSERADLIAMPTHGYGVFRRFLIDSVTAKVLHDVPVPVLTGVHMDEHTDFRIVEGSTLLCAIDLGPQSQEVLEWAAQMARDLGAQLGIVHVAASISPGVEALLPPDTETEMKKKALGEITKLQIAAGAQAATVYIEKGDAPKTVCAVAAAVKAGLLVIGRGILDEDEAGRLRTNAYAIIRQSPCPVISI